MAKPPFPLAAAIEPDAETSETSSAFADTGDNKPMLYPRTAYALTQALEEILVRSYIIPSMGTEVDNPYSLCNITYGNASTWSPFGIVFTLDDFLVKYPDRFKRAHETLTAFCRDMAKVAAYCEGVAVDYDKHVLKFTSPEAYLEFLKEACVRLDLETLDHPYGDEKKLEDARKTPESQLELKDYFERLAEDGLKIDVEIPEAHDLIFTHLPGKIYALDHHYIMMGAVAEHNDLDLPMIDLEYLESVVEQEMNPQRSFIKNPLLNLH